MLRRSSIGSLLLALTLVATPALAEPDAAARETARQLMDKGDAHVEQGELDAALEAYRGADEIMGVPTTGIEVGRTLEALGRLVEARDAYLEVLRYPEQDPDPKAFVTARAEADKLARALGERIPTLTLEIQGPSASALRVTIDGTPLKGAVVSLPRSLDPGEHALVVGADGYERVERQVSLAVGEHKTVTLELVERATEAPDVVVPPTPEPTADDGSDGHFPAVATSAFVVGGAGLIMGAVAGGLTLARVSDLEASCGDDKKCPDDQADNLDSGETLANVSNAGFAIGGAGVALGLIAILTFDAPSDGDAEAALTPLVGPGWLGLRGRF